MTGARKKNISNSQIAHPLRDRMLFVVRLMLAFAVIFVFQKIVFTFCNLSYAGDLTVGDWLAIVWHGLPLDWVTICYLTAIPSLVVAVSFFVPNFRLRAWLLPYYILVSLLLSLIFVADVVVYGFWGSKIDATDLMYVQHPKEMLASVLWWQVMLGAFVIMACTAAFAWLMCWITPRRLTNRPRWFSVLVMIPLWALLTVGVRGGLKTSTANPSYAYFSSRVFLNHAALNPAFNMIHSMVKVEDFKAEFQYFDDEQFQRLVAGNYYVDGEVADTLLSTRRPDILLIVWEGGGKLMVMNDSVGEGLAALKKDGLYFSNCYANGVRTDRGLVSIFSGWPTMPTASLMKQSDMCGVLPGLAGALRGAGYSTRFVYGGDVDFTNMRGYLYESGFEKVEGAEAFPESRHLSDWGAPDKYLFEKYLSTIGQSDGPTFTALLTLSSHEPWVVPTTRFADRRHNAFAYTDSCIYAAISQLRRSPYWENLLVIVVPDHGVPLYDGQANSDPSVAEIPMVWTGGALRRRGVVDQMFNQSDLAATLLAQLGIDASGFVLSRNVFSPKAETCYPFVTNVFKGGVNYIDTTGITQLECADCSVTYSTPAVSAMREARAKAFLQQLYTVTGHLR